MTIMRLLLSIATALLLAGSALCRPGDPLFADDTRAVALPVLTQLPAGQVLLSWTEKDPDGKLFLYTALSADKGKTFSDKNLVYAANGIGASRLMKPRVLAKPNGTLVAVFTLRTESAQPAPAAAPADNHAGMNHGGHQPAAATATPAEKPRGRRAPATTQIVTTTSTDLGRTWTEPQPVDSDKTPNLLRGFFDATVLSNGEIAIAYLKDVAGSTKHEERNLRLVVTQNGQFQPERIIDPVACDCCNISMLVDANGTLNIYYRDNNDDIRDISRLQSTDNGKTFTAPKNLYADNWKINGCPHSGPSSVRLGKSALVAWFSGTTSNTAGVRVVTQEGERLAVVEDPSAKNASLVQAPNAGVLVWEQVRGAGETPTTAIAYRVINAKKAADTQWLTGSEQGQNASGLVVGDQLLVAYELRRPGKPNALQLGYASVK